MIANTLRTVVVDVLCPLGVYFGLTAGGLAPAWALAASAGVSIVALGVRWVRTREVSLLGALVLVRFALGLALAFWTGDARIVLVKDFAITFVIALAASATLRLERPFIARIRRDLSPDRARFDEEWTRNASFRTVHHRLSRLWVIGLMGEVAVAVVVVHTAPLAAAVVVTSILSPAVLLTLIAVTQIRARRATTPGTTDAAAEPRWG